MTTIICACGRTFKSEASLVTHLEANPNHWRPGRIPDDMKDRVNSKINFCPHGVHRLAPCGDCSEDRYGANRPI